MNKILNDYYNKKGIDPDMKDEYAEKKNQP